MGSSKSKQVINIMNDISNKSVLNILQRNMNEQNTTVRTVQNARVKLGPRAYVECTNANGTLINQTLNGTFRVLSNTDAQTTSDLKSFFENNLDNDISQVISQMQQMGGGIGNMNKHDNYMQIKNQVQNLIEKNITQESVNRDIKQFKFEQNGDLQILGYYKGPCTFINQDMLLELQANGIVSSLAKAVTEDRTVNEIVNKASQETEIVQTGIAEVVDSIGEAVSKVVKAVGTTMMMPLIILGVAALIILGGGGALAKGVSSNKKGIVIGLLVIGVILLIGGVIWYFVNKQKQQQQDEKGGYASKECEPLRAKVQQIYDEALKEPDQESYYEFLKSYQDEFIKAADCACRHEDQEACDQLDELEKARDEEDAAKKGDQSMRFVDQMRGITW
jgi:hypothetical protein